MRIVVGRRLRAVCAARRHRRAGRLRRHPIAQLRGRSRELERAIVVGGFACGLRCAPQPDDRVDAFATLPQVSAVWRPQTTSSASVSLAGGIATIARLARIPVLASLTAKAS